MDVDLARLIEDALERRRASPPPREPWQNTPWQQEPRRLPRARTYRDPTGETAIGNLTKKEKQR